MTPTEYRINDIGYNGLNILKLSKTDSTETLVISLEEGSELPEHSSPKDALLVVLTGEIIFKIEETEIKLNRFDHHKFMANVAHSVEALQNSKFLIIR